MRRPWEEDERDDEIKYLRRQLELYGRHQEGCDAHWGAKYRCRCGWREVYPVLYGQAEGVPVLNEMTAPQLMALHFPRPWEEENTTPAGERE